MNPALILQLVTLFAKNGDAISKILPVVLPLAQQLIGSLQRPQANAEPMDMRWLQRSLNTLVGAGLEVDGINGEATRRAVRMFQERFMPNEAADGWAGIKTQTAIIAALEKVR
jgi:peptidoglycan hydrolase-like protein with peptidoglycan-binding domain